MTEKETGGTGTQGTAGAATYHLRPVYRAGILLVAGLSVGFAVGLPVIFLPIADEPGMMPVIIALSACALLIFLIMGVLVARAAFGSSVTVRPDGVEYRGLGYRLVAPWSDVARLEPVVLGAMSGDALVLARPSVARGGGWIRFANLDLSALMGPGFDRVIPLTQFANPLEGSALLEDLRRYVPSVVAEYERRR